MGKLSPNIRPSAVGALAADQNLALPGGGLEAVPQTPPGRAYHRPMPRLLRVMISAAMGNGLSLNADGLFATPGGGATWGTITGTLSAQTDLQAALDAKVPTTRTLTAGTGLTGGGDLSADRTFNLADTAVTPSTYGGAAVSAQFTVDQQGRITAVTPIAIAIAASALNSGQVSRARGGTGTDSSAWASGSFARTNGSGGFDERTAANVLSDIGAVPTSRTITAGTGMTGGGDLSANRTLTLADTAVTPGTYGGAAVAVQIAVDQQGRLTAATPIAIAISASAVTSGTFGTSMIADDAITNAKLRNSAATSVIGRSANSTGDPGDIAASTTGHVLRLSGTTLAFGTLEAGAFASNTVPRTALANGTALTVIGRSANSAGAVADISAGTDHQVLRRSGATLGFGAIALNQAAAVTGQLPAANVATGTSGAAIPLLNGANTHSGLATFTGGVYDNGGMRVKVADYTGGGTLTTDDYYAIVAGVSGVTLPASPAEGQTLVLREIGGGGSCTVARNGNNIDLAAANYTLAAGGTVRLVFFTGVGWITFAG